jgi:hypothetical protein
MDQAATHSPEYLQADLALQEAVKAYSADQNEMTRRTLRKATNYLQRFLPEPPEGKVYPSHLRMLELMPEHLRYPDPIWGDALFD